MRIKVWLGVFLSLGLIALLIYFIRPAQVWAVLKTVNLYYLPAVMFLSVAFLWIRAVRWRYLLEPVKRDLPMSSLFSATMIGFMANNVLPFRLGELARAYVLGRSEEIPKGAVFTTIVVERLFDSMSVLLLLIYTLAFLPPELASGGAAASIHKAGKVSFGLFVAIIFVLAYFLYRPGKLPKAVRAVIAPLSRGLADKAAYIANSFIVNLGVVKDPRLLSLILFYSALHWGLLWTPVYLLFKAFGLHFGVYESVYLFVVMAFSVALPSTPGYVGTFHAAVTAGLMFLGLKPGPAFGFALVSHAASVVPVTLFGFYYLYKENLSLKGLKKAEA